MLTGMRASWVLSLAVAPGCHSRGVTPPGRNRDTPPAFAAFPANVAGRSPARALQLAQGMHLRTKSFAVSALALCLGACAVGTDPTAATDPTTSDTAAHGKGADAGGSGNDAGTAVDGSAVKDASALNAASASNDASAPNDAQPPPPPPPDAAPISASHWVNGYYVGYQNNLLAPADIDWTNLTHLSVGAVIPNADGTLDTSFYIDNTNGPLWAKQTVTLAHQNGRKAIVMLGGAATRTGWVGAMSSNRAAFEQNLLNLAKNYGFDGFDLDWEDFPTSDEPLMLALVQDLRKALPSTLITIPVGWLNANDNPLKASAIYATLAPLVDQLNIMSYGMAGPWGGWKTWHSAALGGDTPSTPSSVKSSIQGFLNAGVPAAKMGIGIGFYGSCWAPGVTAPNQALGSATIVADDNVMSYRHIYETYLTPQVLQWDSTASATYLSFSSPHGPEGCTFVSYEDEKSITEKAKYVKSAGLGGAIIWTIGEGHLPSLAPGKRDPLLTALGTGLQ